MANPAEPLIGGLLIEVFFAFILYGVTCLQTFMYFQKYSGDSSTLKALAAAVWLLETVHTGFCMQFVYAYLVAGFGDSANMMNINWGIGITVLSSAGVSLCVQGYYTWRIWIISGKSVASAVIIGFFLFLRVALGIASTVFSYIYPQWDVFRHTTESLVTVSGGIGCAALVDLLVACMLIFYLKRGRHVWHKESNTMVNRILLYSVNTGAITGTTSLLCVILFAVKKTSLVFLGLVTVQTKLLANSLLGSLNARSHIRSKGSKPVYASSSSGGFRIRSPRVPVQVEVYQQTDVLNHSDLPSGNDEYNMKGLKGGEHLDAEV
ncbi:hypothetical protein BV20DRAFT_1029224 [Pilatotrama ljubarskyi]|nr:hypothetical protein BV20DRAFT_1029224 [Pilatotrama ljubarskyi]